MSNEKKDSWFIGIITFLAFGLVIGFFGYYWIHLPDPHYVSNKEAIGISGTFGDSFGVLTCLFSGLSSAGMIVAILMQREELKLQRKELANNGIVLAQQQLEFEKTAKSQLNNVKLSALMSIFKEDEKGIKLYTKTISDYDKWEIAGDLWRSEEQGENIDYLHRNYEIASKINPVLNARREIILSEIEKIIIESGVDLPPLPE